MLNSQEEEEFITVRVQDPRIQNQGSWIPYIEYKIFLYTNSKAFTVKTSCVRRRYREFVWLKCQLQRNAGLVSLPELPGKNPFFPVHNRERIERRRQGLQKFLEKVLHMTVFLSDTLLHLFVQTQLPPAEMEGCVLGRTPYSATEAILSYAMSNKTALHEEDSAGVSTVAYECQSSPNHTLAGAGESDSESNASNPGVENPSITEEVTPTLITQEVTPASITQKITPASTTEEVTPTSITREVTPASIAQEVTFASITQEVTPSSITKQVISASNTKEVTTGSITQEVTPVSMTPEVTSVLITQEVTSMTQEESPPPSIKESPSPMYNGL